MMYVCLHEVDILRRQVTYHVYNAGCFIRLNRVSYPGYVVYIISGATFGGALWKLPACD